ncbi:uncharacterized protein AMSG_10205 [Thecamonas trahens ATCC 50062]|uniref:Sushi domain-containing protein n=1 Tax=Thecamonas trahens ATCC 50062 TaxID=461836 RepID=A0A0L0DRN7_THETB|nr:hypothetical protein AMSG_10205 [Thecamonas trahens ATCC 50062]KNC54960.1 hypothetical protein AMSG_10205 [Thecamonas trahens ATCC 50062]|eukprot:XP_013753407.1 hypothetical protein AMSG_10205 [Thecamonas trahens ATCC 50062]
MRACPAACGAGRGNMLDGMARNANAFVYHLPDSLSAANLCGVTLRFSTFPTGVTYALYSASSDTPADFTKIVADTSPISVDALGGDEYDLVLAERLPLVAGTHYALAVASASTGSPYAESIALPAVACSGGISYTRSFSGAGLSPPASLASLGTSTSELMGGSLTICPSCPTPQPPVGGSVSITSSVAGGARVSPGDVVTYACDAPNNPVGSLTATCLSDGTYDTAAPTCLDAAFVLAFTAADLASPVALSVALSPSLSGAWSADGKLLTITLGTPSASAQQLRIGSTIVVPTGAVAITTATGWSLPATSPSAKLSGTWGSLASTLMLINDATGAITRLSPSSVFDAGELVEGDALSVLAQLSKPPSSAVAIDLSFADGSNSPIEPGRPAHLTLTSPTAAPNPAAALRLVFDAFNWNVFQRIEIRSLADSYASEDPAAVVVALTPAPSSDASFVAAFAGARLTAVVVDATPEGLSLAPHTLPFPIPPVFLSDESSVAPGTTLITEAGHVSCSAIALQSTPWLAGAGADARPATVRVSLKTPTTRLRLVRGAWDVTAHIPPLRITQATPVGLALRATLDVDFDASNWNLPQPFCVVAITDDEPDNSANVAVTYAIAGSGTRSTPFAPAINALPPSQIRIVSASWPLVTGTRPRVAAMAGSMVTLLGRNLGLNLDLDIASQLAPVDRSNVTMLSPSSELQLLTAPVESKGYLAVTVTEPTTRLFAIYSDLFFTDDCPYEGQFGRGTACGPCPIGAICPGGYRLWPQPGYWTEAEDAGYVAACASPASERCAGGKASGCGSGYRGRMCAQCDVGYYQLGSRCVACSDSKVVFVTLILTNVVFGLLFLAAVVLLSDAYLNVATQLLLAVVMVYSVAKTNAGAMDGFLAEAYQLLSIVAMDLRFVRPGCETIPGSYLALFYGAVSMCAAMALLVVATLAMLLRLRRSAATFYADRLPRALLIFSTMVYITLTTTFLEALFCVPGAGGDRVVAAARDMVCLKGSHRPMFVLALIGVIAYAAGFPLLVMYKLRSFAASGLVSNVDDEAHARVRARYGYLFEQYTESMYWWILAQLALFGSIALANVFLRDFEWIQACISASALFAVAILALVLRPAKVAWKNGVTAGTYLTGAFSTMSNQIVASSLVSRSLGLTLSRVVFFIALSAMLAGFAWAGLTAVRGLRRRSKVVALSQSHLAAPTVAPSSSSASTASSDSRPPADILDAARLEFQASQDLRASASLVIASISRSLNSHQLPAVVDRSISDFKPMSSSTSSTSSAISSSSSVSSSAAAAPVPADLLEEQGSCAPLPFLAQQQSSGLVAPPTAMSPRSRISPRSPRSKPFKRALTIDLTSDLRKTSQRVSSSISASHMAPDTCQTARRQRRSRRNTSGAGGAGTNSLRQLRSIDTMATRSPSGHVVLSSRLHVRQMSVDGTHSVFIRKSTLASAAVGGRTSPSRLRSHRSESRSGLEPQPSSHSRSPARTSSRTLRRSPTAFTSTSAKPRPMSLSHRRESSADRQLTPRSRS